MRKNFEIIWSKVMKRVILSLVLLLCLNQAAGADVQTFELSWPVAVMTNQLPEEARMLTSLQVKLQLRNNIVDYLMGLSAFAGLDRQTQVTPMAVLLFPLEVLELSEGHAIKVKALVDSNRLPENPAQYLKDNSEAIETVYRHMLHSRALEQDFSAFMQRLQQATAQEAVKMQMSEGKQLETRMRGNELFLQGCESIGLSRWSIAESQLSQAIALTPDYGVAYYMRGITRLYTRDYDKAIADFNQDIKLDPQNQGGYFMRGIVYTIQGALPEQAISDLSKAIEADSQNGQAYYLRGVNYANTKRCDKAQADYTKACNLGYDKACHKECRVDAPREIYREMGQ